MNRILFGGGYVKYNKAFHRFSSSLVENIYDLPSYSCIHPTLSEGLDLTRSDREAIHKYMQEYNSVVDRLIVLFSDDQEHLTILKNNMVHCVNIVLPSLG